MALDSNKFKIITEVVKILRESAPLVEMIGDKIFPIIAPEGTEGDFIAYQRDGLDTSSNKMGNTALRSFFYITVVSDDYDRCLNIASLVSDALQGNWRDPDIRIDLCDYTEDFTDKKFFQVLQFSIL